MTAIEKIEDSEKKGREEQKSVERATIIEQKEVDSIGLELRLNLISAGVDFGDLKKARKKFDY